MKTVLFVCLSLVVLTAVAGKMSCTKHADGEPGQPCAGYPWARSPRLRTTWCCKDRELYPVLWRRKGIVSCTCETGDAVCRFRPWRCYYNRRLKRGGFRRNHF
ncbi:hypothetical protein ElyMa_001331200 [Elysia marginata]|uniref:Uncharacterized protein n=1 Tax=Elysia marginata TaxID=1093978 RepID=A0AAV4IP79_9GAST|nr:hypothetical protein ElyMa_001331200 [Elysia marginata]